MTGWLIPILSQLGMGAGVPNVVAPVAGFTGTPVSGTAPLTVAFTNTSTGTITSLQFDPGDGSGVLSSFPASHVYAAGTYSPSLMVNGPGGSNTLTRTNYITATTPADDPWTVAGYWAVPLTSGYWTDNTAQTGYWQDV